MKSFKRALEADPDWAPAHDGLARVLEDDDPPQGRRRSGKAVAIDPQLADAHLLLASLHLDADRDARRRAPRSTRCSPSNPSQLEAHALARRDGVRQGRQGRPRPRGREGARDQSQLRRRLPASPGEQAASHYRFDRSAALAEKALALDPAMPRAAADLGMHLLRTGDEPAARRALDRAFRADPYNAVTFNLLHDARQASISSHGQATATSSFRMRPRSGAGAARVRDAARAGRVEDAVGEVRLHAEGPDPRRDVPEARRLRGPQRSGCPGMIGALGACFGRVVTMDSPTRAQPPGRSAGRRRSGTSWRTSSRCRCRSSASRAG